MKNQSIAEAIILLFAELAAFYVIFAYSAGSWSVKIAWLILLAGSGIVYWMLRRKKLNNASLAGEAEWGQIQNSLKDIATTKTYILQLDNVKQLGKSAVFVKDDTTYIGVGNPEHLANIATQLLNYRAGKTLALGLELSFYPTLHTDISARLKDWLRNILFLQKQLDFVVPTNLVIHAPSNLFDSSSLDNAYWVALKLKERCTESDIHRLLSIFQQALAKQFGQAEGELTCRDYVRIIHIIDYLKEIFLKQADSGWSYVNVRSVSVAADASVVSNSAWQKFIGNATGKLIWPHTVKHTLSDSPAILIGKDSVYRRNIIAEIGFKLLSIAALAFLTAAAFSAFNNQSLLKRLEKHMDAVKASVSQSVEVRKLAEEVLQHDLNLLNKYRKEGEPLHLGLGLYQAGRLIPEMERILSVNELVAKPEPAQVSVPEDKAVVLTLNSLALFETGQFELKSNANKALISVLKAIDEHPETQILIEGHTDNVGGVQANQQLSEKRAIAVRDWLVISSNLPVTRFAVKGYGDTRPIASNETDDGRAQNRRVEIILIPDKVMPAR